MKAWERPSPQKNENDDDDDDDAVVAAIEWKLCLFRRWLFSEAEMNESVEGRGVVTEATQTGRKTRPDQTDCKSSSQPGRLIDGTLALLQRRDRRKM